MSQIGIIAFDEVHHADKDHPYAQLMENFYHTSNINKRPQILGLTASPSELLVRSGALLLPLSQHLGLPPVL